MSVEELDLPGSLSGLRAEFAAAQAHPPAPGDHHASFVGPKVLRAAAPRAIALGGMPRWLGKRFFDDGTAVNLLGGDPVREHMTMTVTTQPSWWDGRPAVVVDYGKNGRIPWRWVRDEFRSLDDDHLIGLTFLFTPALKVLAMPFVLTRCALPE